MKNKRKPDSSCACPEGYELQEDGTCKETEKEKEPTDSYEEQKKACDAQGGSWDSSNNSCIIEQVDPYEEQKKACAAQGGTWDSVNNSCIIEQPEPEPEGPVGFVYYDRKKGLSWDSVNNSCIIEQPEPEPEGPVGFVYYDRKKGLYNLFSWL